MATLSWYTDLVLMFVAFIAAIVDTLAGGGGLITTPAILFTGLNPLLCLGTVKLQAAISELSATIHFIRSKQVNYWRLWKLFIYIIISASFGTIFLQYVPSHILEKLIPFFLLGVLIYYILSRRQKLVDNDNDIPKTANLRLLTLGSIIGFYNGFFGPGTGSLWAVALTQNFKLGIRKATMYAKPLNFVGNITALSIFIGAGKVNYKVAILMGVGSFLGGRYGAHLVIKRDTRWLKMVFFILMTVMTIATFIKYYFL